MTPQTTSAAEGEVDVDIADALRMAGISEVDDSSRRRAEYTTDASNYRVVPRVVVFPRHTDEVAASIAVARELGVPIVPRGAGTVSYTHLTLPTIYSV